MAVFRRGGIFGSVTAKSVPRKGECAGLHVLCIDVLLPMMAPDLSALRYLSFLDGALGFGLCLLDLSRI